MPRFSDFFFQAGRIALSDSAKSVAATVTLQIAWNTYERFFDHKDKTLDEKSLHAIKPDVSFDKHRDF